MKRSHIVLFNLAALSIIVAFQACTNAGLPNFTTGITKAFSPSAQEIDAGHEHGNGGDDIRFAKAAWFTDTGRNVHYCVQISNDFLVPRDRVLKEVSAALNDWGIFLAKSRTYSLSLVSRTFSLTEDCSQADLRFLLGGPPPSDGTSKIGEVHRESLDMLNNWSRGSLWISSQAANWSDDFRLKGALLHLIGEILGFANVSGTILDHQWESWLLAEHTPELEQKLKKIENDRRLASVLDTFDGKVTLTPKLKDLFGVTADQVDVSVSISNLTMNLQGTSLRFVIAFSRYLKRGDLHRVAYFNKTPLFNFMKKIPQVLNADDNTEIDIVQFLDLPGQPQMILELNGDQAIGMSSL